MGRKGRSKKDAAEDRDPGMCKADLLLAYQLMDTTNPFPSASVAARQPLAWKVCCALAQADSLHPGCMFVHMLCLVALTLNAVQVKILWLAGKILQFDGLATWSAGGRQEHSAVARSSHPELL